MSLNVSLGPWKLDRSTSRCESCSAAFTLFRRRHHCRCCGGIFCSACTNQVCSIPTYPSLIPQRVCRDCHGLLATREAGRNQQRDRVLLPQSCQPQQALTATTASSTRRCDIGTAGESLDGRAAKTSPRESPAISDDVNGGAPNGGNGMDSSSDGDDDAVSTALAGVLSSWDEHHTSSVSFLPALKDNIVQSGDLALLNVLLFPSPQCFTVSVLTLSPDERMSDLVGRLAEVYFKLANGPFKRMTESSKADLCEALHFYSELQVIPADLLAVKVAKHCSHVVLTSLSQQHFEKERDTAAQVSSLRHFFNHEHALAVSGAE